LQRTSPVRGATRNLLNLGFEARCLQSLIALT
jgi:hypothetical protein